MNLHRENAALWSVNSASTAAVVVLTPFEALHVLRIARIVDMNQVATMGKRVYYVDSIESKLQSMRLAPHTLVISVLHAGIQ